MAKTGEIDFMKNIGEKGVQEVMQKPFSNDMCGEYLVSIGAIMLLLPRPPATLLDLGCGAGWTSIFFAKRGYQVTGVDIAPDMIRCAHECQQRDNELAIRFMVSDYESLDFNESFDCAVFYDALHHAVDEQEALRAAYRSLKPGGICIISEPGRGHEQDPRTIEAVKAYNVTEKGMPPKKVASLAKKIGFSRITIYPHPNQYNRWMYGKPMKPFIKLLMRFTVIKALMLFIVAVYYKRLNGLTVLQK
jgi:ubiquinone/menaquinone biosynthesis C-methylase UbiE